MFYLSALDPKEDTLIQGEIVTCGNWHILGNSAEGSDECHGHGALK